MKLNTQINERAGNGFLIGSFGVFEKVKLQFEHETASRMILSVMKCVGFAINV